jgi:uncharacterized membrane protein YeaQ/YmgE (transglycosylase-associated protein family)
MSILWIILIGFVAGIIARALAPGPNNASGFILTAGLGIGGAFLAAFIGPSIGWYRLDQGAGLIGAMVGAVLVCSSGTAWSQAVPSPIQAVRAAKARSVSVPFDVYFAGSDLARQRQ